MTIYLLKAKLEKYISNRMFTMDTVIKGLTVEEEGYVEAKIVKKELQRLKRLVERGYFDWQQESE